MQLKSKAVIIPLTFLVISLIYIFLLKTSIIKNDDPSFNQKIEFIPKVSVAKNTDIIFILNESYKAGERIEIKIKNIGNISYVNKALVAPCALEYFNTEGRRFYPPEAIACDLWNSEEIKPGELVTEFKLTLKECVKQEDFGWGCAEAKNLVPGIYTIRGLFSSKDGKSDVLAEVQITVVK